MTKQKITDSNLEIINKYLLDSEIHPNIKKNEGYNLSTYWKEYNGLFLTTPRRTGKTSILIKIAEFLLSQEEKFLLVCSNETMKGFFPKEVRDFTICTIHALVFLKNFEDTTLLIDEFTFISNLDGYLNYPWKRVIGLSSPK